MILQTEKTLHFPELLLLFYQHTYGASVVLYIATWKLFKTTQTSFGCCLDKRKQTALAECGRVSLKAHIGGGTTIFENGVIRTLSVKYNRTIEVYYYVLQQDFHRVLNSLIYSITT